MLRRGDQVLVAVSGGGDSMALLHYFVALSKQRGIQVSAFHLNHQLRGREADADEAAVRRYCDALGVALTVHREDVAARAKRARQSLEEAGRAARYEHLGAVCRRIGANRIATAHTATDNAETVLMRILQGTSLDGLGGIPPVRDSIIRPFISVSYEQVRAYASRHKVPFRDDSSNRDIRFLRNRIRRHVMPLLQKEINAQVVAALNRLSAISQGERQRLDRELKRAYRRFALGRTLSLKVFNEAEWLRRRVVRDWLMDNGIKPDLATIDRMEDLWMKRHGASLDLPGGLRLYREIKYMSLVLPGEAPESVSLTAEIRPADGFTLPPDIPPDEAYLDADRVAGEPRIRYWIYGDRFHPLGAPGAAKLQDFFVNQKVPRHLKSRIPLVVDDEKILWVIGYRISDAVKLTPATTRLLHLKITK
ncbi:MAG: tRNA lysidine(34) synthetase TilS [bacterium]